MFGNLFGVPLEVEHKSDHKATPRQMALASTYPVAYYRLPQSEARCKKLYLTKL